MGECVGFAAMLEGRVRQNSAVAPSANQSVHTVDGLANREVFHVFACRCDYSGEFVTWDGVCTFGSIFCVSCWVPAELSRE